MISQKLKTVVRIGRAFLVCVGMMVTCFAREGDVRRISGQMSDGVSITVWVDPPSVVSGRAIVLRYRVTNRSKRKIYLVRETPPYINVDGPTIAINVPVPSSNMHGSERLSFEEIERGGVRHGSLSIPPEKYQSRNSWHVEVGFAYIAEFPELRQTRAPEKRMVLRENVFRRAETLSLGSLSVEVTK